LLSSDGDIYWFGFNGIEEQKKPQKLLINSNKFIDIESHHVYNILIAFSTNGIYYIWGKCGESEKLKEPKETKLKSFNDIFFHYCEITHKTLSFLNTIDLRALKNGKYQKEFIEQCLIGYGTFSIVTKAFNRNDKKVYALKKIPLDDLEYISRELDIVFKLKEDFVVKFINFWAENNYFRNKVESHLYEDIEECHLVFDPRKTILLHIQMELCFKTLKEILDGELKEILMTPLGYYISSELFIELLECVQHIHKQNIIHRNLKPKNILIYNGLNKIGDFFYLLSMDLMINHTLNAVVLSNIWHQKYLGGENMTRELIFIV
jgi:serine/threonine protein kinase